MGWSLVFTWTVLFDHCFIKVSISTYDSLITRYAISLYQAIPHNTYNYKLLSCEIFFPIPLGLQKLSFKVYHEHVTLLKTHLQRYS